MLYMVDTSGAGRDLAQMGEGPTVPASLEGHHCSDRPGHSHLQESTLTKSMSRQSWGCAVRWENHIPRLTALVGRRHKCSEDVGLLRVLDMRHTDCSMEAVKMSGSVPAAFLPKDAVGLALVADIVVVGAAQKAVLLVAGLRRQPCKMEQY